MDLFGQAEHSGASTYSIYIDNTLTNKDKTYLPCPSLNKMMLDKTWTHNRILKFVFDCHWELNAVRNSVRHLFNQRGHLHPSQRWRSKQRYENDYMQHILMTDKTCFPFKFYALLWHGTIDAKNRIAGEISSAAFCDGSSFSRKCINLGNYGGKVWLNVSFSFSVITDDVIMGQIIAAQTVNSWLVLNKNRNWKKNMYSVFLFLQELYRCDS